MNTTNAEMGEDMTEIVTMVNQFTFNKTSSNHTHTHTHPSIYYNGAHVIFVVRVFSPRMVMAQNDITAAFFRILSI